MKIANLLIFVISFGFMELASWTIHKYILHSWLWKVHKTHHGHGKKMIFELNDVVSVFFGLISIVLIITGLPTYDYKLWIGTGIAVYGILYFILHDILIHKRIKIPARIIRNKYINAISKAHRAHHKQFHRKPSESFGLLWVDKKYFENKEE